MKKKKSQAGSARQFRMADQIQKDLSQMIAAELPMSAYGMITVQAIDLSSDFSFAKVYFTVLGGDPVTVEELLNKKAGYFYSQLFKLLPIHTVPMLKFVYDATTENAFKMDALIARAVGNRSEMTTENLLTGSTEDEASD